MTGRVLVSALLTAGIACGGAPPSPARLESGIACASCRMMVSDVHFAAQIVERGEEPLFFDDIGCLTTHLRRKRPGAGAVVYVADHRTGEWVHAGRAVYTRTRDVPTPMSGGVIAHGDAASRGRDPAAWHGTNVAAPDILEPVLEASR